MHLTKSSKVFIQHALAWTVVVFPLVSCLSLSVFSLSVPTSLPCLATVTTGVLLRQRSIACVSPAQVCEEGSRRGGQHCGGQFVRSGRDATSSPSLLPGLPQRVCRRVLGPLEQLPAGEMQSCVLFIYICIYMYFSSMYTLFFFY